MARIRFLTFFQSEKKFPISLKITKPIRIPVNRRRKMKFI